MKALFDMAPFKSRGIDGIHAGYCWIHFAALSLIFFEIGTLPDGSNDTLIVLIPKVEHQEQISHFRRISLCNMGYKVVTKTITNRLKEIMGKLITPNQSSFVPGRQIMDNIIIYQEVLNSMRRNTSGKGYMLIKVDLEKAYDRLSWSFIRDT